MCHAVLSITYCDFTTTTTTTITIVIYKSSKDSYCKAIHTLSMLYTLIYTLNKCHYSILYIDKIMAEELIPANPPYTVYHMMLACECPIDRPHEGENQAQRIASELFLDDFNTCKDKTHEEVDDDLKSFSSLAVRNGQIVLRPIVKRNIKAFIQWTKDMYRTGIDPASRLFPIGEVANLLRRHKSHEAFVDKAKTMTENAKPKHFTDKIKWEDWNPTFLNFLRSIPGRDGVPLNYVCRDSEEGEFAPNDDFLEDYVSKAPLNGEAFIVDANEVHVYLTNFCASNVQAEAQLRLHANEHNGRLDYLALKEHYEGSGLFALDVQEAENILEDLHYSGEKHQMWWAEFERQLNRAFMIFDKSEQRQVHSNTMKLRILNRKIKCDFLEQTRISLTTEMNRTPMTLTYANAMQQYRNEVNHRHPPHMSNMANTPRNRRNNRRSVHEVRGGSRNNRGRGGRGRGGRNRGGRGRGGRHYNGQKRGQNNDTQGSTTVTCSDGTIVNVHPANYIDPATWNKLPNDVKSKLSQQRQEYKRRRNISESNTGTSGQSMISDISHDNAPPSGSTSIMGGRNEQADLRSRNTNNN